MLPENPVPFTLNYEALCFIWIAYIGFSGFNGPPTLHSVQWASGSEGVTTSRIRGDKGECRKPGSLIGFLYGFYKGYDKGFEKKLVHIAAMI